MRSILRFAVAASLLALILSTPAQSLPSGVQKRASAGGITEYPYPNASASYSTPTRPSRRSP